MEQLKHQHSIEWISNLRIVALLAVITLHTASPLLALYGKVPCMHWFAADFYNGLVRFAVPVFVMITGALLLHRDYELGEFLKKRLSRIITPFLFWSLVYIAYFWYNEEISFDADWWTNFKQVLHLLKYGSSYHLWYIYMLVGLYFAIPVIGKFVRNATEKEIQYFLVVWFVVMMLNQPYLARFNPKVDLKYFANYIGYLVLGHYLAFKAINYKYIRVTTAGVFLLGLGLIVTGTWWLYQSSSPIGTLFYEPVNPAILVLAASLFLFSRFTFVKLSATVKRLRDFAGDYNYGIYLSHALILYLLEDVGISYKLCTPFVSIPVTAVSCFILSLVLVFLLGKLPYGRWISG